MTSLSSIPNPYTFDVPTDPILYLYNLIRMYDNPLASIEDATADHTYVMMDVFQFNPYETDKRLRYLLMDIVTATSTINFYSVNMGLGDTLTSLEKVTNKYQITGVQFRIKNMYSTKSKRLDQRWKVPNINKLIQTKVFTNAIANLPSIQYILWDRFLVSFNLFIPINTTPEPVRIYRLCLTQTAYADPKIGTYNFERIFYDYCTSTVIGKIDDKPIFYFNDVEFYYLNPAYYINYDPNKGQNLTVVGSLHAYSVRPVSGLVAEVTPLRELQYQSTVNSIRESELFTPLSQYFVILCGSISAGNYYLFGFVSINDPNNFSTIIEASQFINQVETFLFLSVRSQFTQEPLPQTPIFDKDGLIIWITPIYFIIFQPTFPDFLAKYGVLEQGVANLDFVNQEDP